ncbi:MAG: hypothetical protein R3C17_17495 [Planctomycetaceae bacterium]
MPSMTLISPNTTEAVPLWQGFITDLNANYTAWVNETADAEQTYGDELADNAVDWMQDFDAVEESCSNEFVTHWVIYVQASTALHVAQIATIGGALDTWAATVAALVNGTSGTPTFVVTATQGQTATFSGSSANGGTTFPPLLTGKPQLPEGCSLDPRTGFVYQGNTLFGIIDQDGNVVWPTSWPPGGPTATVTSLGPDVEAAFLQSYFSVAANLRVKLQARYGSGTVKLLPKLPGGSVNQQMTRTTNIPEGFIVGCGGAEPCILVLVVSGDSVLAYHFNSEENPHATLTRDQALMRKGSHVMLAAGNNTPQSNITLSLVNVFLTETRPDLIVDGLVDSCDIYVDRHGVYFVTKNGVQLYPGR